jgi:hypothetical protein
VEQNGTALAVPALSDKQIKTRLEVAREPGYGLESATPKQINMIGLLCQRYRLDPLLHLTLYRGRPWVTIDGRVELAKRNPDYKDFRTRPLSKDEKEAWDYRADDLVVECTVRTYSGAEYVSRGKVSAVERGKNAPTGTNPQEMAEKRALARTLRLAFGQSAFLDDDEDDVDPAVEREKTARLSQRYAEIFPEEEDEEDLPPTDLRKAQAQPGVSASVGDAPRAAKNRNLDLEEIDRQRREEGLI